MVEEVKMYRAVCDRCGRKHRGNDDIIAWPDADCAIEEAFFNEWYEINGRLLCPDCYEYDENTDECVECLEKERR